MNHKNRPLTSFLDQKIEVKTTPQKVIYAPVVIPIGFATLLSDVFILHPVSTLIPASQDAFDALWSDPQGGVVTQTFLFIPKVILTPAFIGVNALIRSIFDVSR